MNRGEAFECAASFFRLVSASKVEDAVAILADDGTWWANGMPEPVPMEIMKPLLREIFAAAPTEFTIIQSTVEGTRVALETRNHMRFSDGAELDARYVFVVELAGDCIASVREYQDTTKSTEILTPRIADILKGAGLA